MRTRKFLSSLIPALPMLLTALLVILVTVIFLAAMRSKAHAQFSIAEQPMFQLTSVASTPYLVGLSNLWSFTNLPLGIATTWTDQIGGVILFATNAATAPTNTSTGLFFSGGDDNLSTTNVIHARSPNSTYFMVFSLQAGAVNHYYFLYDNPHFGRFGSTYIWSDSINSGAVKPTVTNDIAISWTNNVDHIGGFSTTNGLVAITNISAIAQANLNFLGGSGGGGAFGRILELHFYGRSLTFDEIYYLHTNAAAIYGYPP